MATYSENDWRNYSEDSLEHGWGKSPEQKAREKEYNHQYWLDNKDRILKQRRLRYGFKTGLLKEGGHLSEDGGGYVNPGETTEWRAPDRGDRRDYRNARRSERLSEYERQREINDEVAALKNRNAANYRQSQIDAEVSALKNQNAANYRQSQIDAEVSAHKGANASRYAASQAVAKRGYQEDQGNARAVSEGRYSDSGTGNARAAVRSIVVKPGEKKASASSASNAMSYAASGAKKLATLAKQSVNQVAARAREIGAKAMERIYKVQLNKR